MANSYLDYPNDKGWAFTGGGSFVSNHYVIYADRSVLDDRYASGYAPRNNYGWMQAQSEITRLFYTRSTNSLSSFHKFLVYLQAIIDQEREKERAYLDLKLDTLSMAEDKKRAIKLAMENNDFNAAYTILYNFEKDLKDIKEELQSSKFKSLQKMKSFWGSQFYDYFSKRIQEIIKIDENDFSLKVINNSNESIESIVNSYIYENVGDSKVTQQSVETIRQQIINELQERLQKAGFDDIAANQSITNFINAHTPIKKLQNKELKWKNKNKARSFNSIMNNILRGIALGMSTEIQAAGQQERAGNVAINTGAIKKILKEQLSGEEFSVQQKGDLIAFTTTAGIDVEKIIEEVWEENSEITSEQLEEIRKRINAQLAQNPTEQIFEIDENVKGYMSKHNLQIEGTGSFKNRVNNLLNLQVAGIDSNMFDKLIFMLNNTAENCVANKHQGQLIQYLATICVAWMWDDYTDMLSLTENQTSNTIQRIHVFNSGGARLTASGIMQQLYNNLKETSQQSVDSPTSLVDITINPGRSSFMSTYQKSKEGKQYSVKGLSLDDYDTWQSQLKNRWDQVRNEIQDSGQLGIKFRQSVIDEMLSNLTSIISQSV